MRNLAVAPGRSAAARKAEQQPKGVGHIARQAEYAQKGLDFQSEAHKRLDCGERQVEMLRSQVGVTLVQLRQKLQPFIDEGVVYKDRKLVNKKKKRHEISLMKENELEEAVGRYKEQIQACIKHKRLYELEKVLNALTLSPETDPDSLAIYRGLRLNIIHG